jgi:hypothetical protein
VENSIPFAGNLTLPQGVVQPPSSNKTITEELSIVSYQHLDNSASSMIDLSGVYQSISSSEQLREADGVIFILRRLRKDK